MADINLINLVADVLQNLKCYKICRPFFRQRCRTDKSEDISVLHSRFWGLNATNFWKRNCFYFAPSWPVLTTALLNNVFFLMRERWKSAQIVTIIIGWNQDEAVYRKKFIEGKKAKESGRKLFSTDKNQIPASVSNSNHSATRRMVEEVKLHREIHFKKFLRFSATCLVLKSLSQRWVLFTCLLLREINATFDLMLR